jgi:asparagine synthetase B (glutamine-hydrolysing)
MCGFVTLKAGTPVDESWIARRGPDQRSHVTRSGFDFYHYLLHITGEVTPQPFIKGDIVCVFNGEIYNQPYTRSDGEVLIPLYEKYGVEFARHLDGEFAIALYDFSKGLVVFATDPFGTKPMFVRGLESGSYRSALPGVAVPPNTTLIRHFDGRPEQRATNYPFDFNNQHVRTYDRWLDAFSAAVRKRATPHCFIGLSSGYDSGALACELLRQGLEFATYSIPAHEERSVLDARLARTKGRLLHMSVDDYEDEGAFLRRYCEPARFSIEADMNLHCDDLFDDPGAIGSSFIFRRARASGQRVYLSGQGADEILSDYALTPAVSSLRGIFPAQLSVWKNFYGGCQRAYLVKEEHVGGSHGIETRYPFLDAQLVQEFLWLAPELKNERYKAPLFEYFARSDFPFWEGAKRGFAADMNLTPEGDARLAHLLAWKKHARTRKERPVWRDLLQRCWRSGGF